MNNNLFPAICFVALALISSCSSKDDATSVVTRNDSTIVVATNHSTTEGIWNDYLPLKAGAKYKYKYRDEFYGPSELSKKTVGECTWDFVSASTDKGNVQSDSTTIITVVYLVKQSFTGLCITGSSKRDTLRVENEITTVSFNLQNDNKVAFTFIIPYWGKTTWTFDRFVQSDSNTFNRYVQSDSSTLCYTFRAPENRLCLKANVGITSFCNLVQSNHFSYVQYDLIEGPYY